MKLIILGPPASGKGTQAKLLAQKLNLKHISTGDLVRAEINSQTELGKKLQAYTKSGKLVPDSLITPLLKKHLPRDNYILDGYPRTQNQAEQLRKFTEPDFIIHIEVQDSVIIRRVTARRQCPRCRAIYGITLPPKRQGFCDNDNAKLIQRKDDTKEIVSERIQVYKKESEPVLSAFRNKLITVDGSKDPRIILDEILSRMGK